MASTLAGLPASHVVGFQLWGVWNVQAQKAARPNALGGGLPALSRGALAPRDGGSDLMKLHHLPGWS